MAFIKSMKNQSWLLPPNLLDIIPEDHICFLLEEIIGKLDFLEFEIRYSGPGHPAYHPKVLSKTLVQSMLDRVRSSRAISRNVRENVVYMYLAENLKPDFRTISDFRKNNKNLIRNIFKITVGAAKELGAIGLDHLSTDGTKLKACASNRSTLTKEELQIIDEFVNNELNEGIKLDKIEDEIFKDYRGYDQLKSSSKKQIKSLVAKYLKQIKNADYDRLSEIKGIVNNAKKEIQNMELDKVSLTDPESRFMLNKKKKFELSYNPQITVDHKQGFIVANDVCQDGVDFNQLKPQIELVEENCGKLKEGTKISLDNGYHNGENIHYLNDKKLDGYIPDQAEAQKAKGKNIVVGMFDKSNFSYNDKADEFICPKGNKLKFSCEYYSKEKRRNIREYIGVNCKDCLFNAQCTNRKDKVRRLKSYPFEKERRDMAKKMQTKEAREFYKRRKETVEPAIGHIKENLGFRGFLTRGLNTVKNEFNLACAAHNLKKLWLISQKKRKVEGLSKKKINGHFLSDYFWLCRNIVIRLSDSLHRWVAYCHNCVYLRWFLTLNIPQHVVFEHNKFHAQFVLQLNH
jgi:transposase